MSHFHQVNRVYNTNATSGKPSVNRLSVLEVGIHPSLLVNKPCFEMSDRVSGVARIFSQLPGGNNRRDLHTQAHQITTMVDEIIWIRHSVALNVSAVRILPVRPPVIAF